jgi:hypothetical protein
MRVFNASFLPTFVVQFQTKWNQSVFLFVKEPMCHQQSIPYPNPSVTIRLHNRKEFASRFVVQHRFKFVGPFRYETFRADSAHILRVRAKLHVIRIYARSMTAQMIQFVSGSNWSKALFPKPVMSKPKSTSAANSRVSIRPRSTNKPAFCQWIFNRAAALAMAGIVIQPMLADLMAEPRSFSAWGYETAAAQTKAGLILDPCHCSLVMILQIADVATAHQTRSAANTRFLCDGDSLPASAQTLSGRIGAAGIVGVQDSAPSVFPGKPDASIVPFNKALFFGQSGTTAAFTVPDVWSTDARFAVLPTPRLNSGVVALQKLRFSCKQLLAAAVAQSDRIGIGHQISLQDRWSGPIRADNAYRLNCLSLTRNRRFGCSKIGVVVFDSPCVGGTRLSRISGGFPLF